MSPGFARHTAGLARSWPEWTPYAAAVWSLAYAVLGLWWAFGGSGFPFGTGNDPGAHLSLLSGVRRETGAPLVAALGVAGTIMALAMARGRRHGAVRVPLLGFGVAAAAFLSLLLPDFRVLVVVAYAPILVLGAPFGWPGDARLAEALPWPVVNQAVCIAGGLLWAGATLAYLRRSAGACGSCGRSDAHVQWTTAESAARRGRVAVWVAMLVPLVYAATRWLWAAGIPLGLTEEFYQEGVAVRLWQIGAALATLAFAGSLLSFGLVRPWGEVFPRWLPVLGNRRVPPALVIVPAAIVAVLVTTAGLMFVRFAFTGDFRLGSHPVTLRENWGALAPELLWPLWGVALAAAALAYWYRVRGRCRYCGRG